MKNIIVSFLLIISIYACAPALELNTFVVKENSKIVNKSITSLDWFGKNTKVNVVKIKRNGKEINRITSNFVFAVNDSVYILNSSNDKAYISLFFD